MAASAVRIAARSVTSAASVRIPWRAPLPARKDAMASWWWTNFAPVLVNVSLSAVMAFHIKLNAQRMFGCISLPQMLEVRQSKQEFYL